MFARMAAAPAPTMAVKRQRVVKQRLFGKLIQWKGKFGWIKPREEIDHPEFAKRGGKVFIGQEDVEEEIQVKGMVSFFLYCDDTGLGAMNCRPAPAGVAMTMGGAMTSQQHTFDSPAAIGKGGGARRSPTQATWAPTGAKGSSPKGVLQVILKQGGPLGKSRGRSKGGETAAEATTAGGDEEAVNGVAQEERLPPPPPDMTNRQRVLPDRMIGKLHRWRGITGWIRPAEPLAHPMANKHKKCIYLHEVDVEPGTELHQGCQVSFFVYSDEDGLGAEECLLTEEQPEPGEEPAEQQRGGKAGGKGGKTVLSMGNGILGHRNGGKMGGKKGAGGKSPLVQNLKLKRRKGKGTRPEGEEGEAKEKRPGGPDLPRERVSELPVTGEVIAWRGKFGWLKLTEPFEHERLDAHEGKIYVHQNDIILEGPLEVGQAVEFHVYADESGLGAEECTPSI